MPMADSATGERYRVAIEEVFEGPMDLLIHLIRKNEVDIQDIPIAKITDQYLGYIDLLKELDIDFAGEFLVLAATLIRIKARCLLPFHSGEEEEDPRLEIIRPLKEYLEMKSVAEKLIKRELLGQDTFKRGGAEAISREDDMIDGIGIFDLFDAFQKVLDSIPKEHRVELNDEKISVKDRIAQLVDVLEMRDGITFFELFMEKTSRKDIVVTFLAVLEMAKLGLLRIVQHPETGVIRLFYE